MSFADSLQAFATKTKGKLDDTVTGVVTELSSRVIHRTPVGDPKLWKNPPPKDYVPGRARGNWQLEVGGMPSSETGRLDKVGEVTLGAITARIPAQSAGRVYFIANLVPYGPRLEDGWSTQAPAGMVGLTAIEFPQIVAAAAGAQQ
jgi:hypothetical protein